LTEFNKIVDDLVIIEVKFEDEEKALPLLCALLRYYEHFKETMLYGKKMHHQLGGSLINVEN